MNRSKAVPCQECKGTGHIVLATAINDYCGIGSKICDSCNGTGVRWGTVTNADHLRTLDDWELAQYIYRINCTDYCYCRNLQECGDDLKNDRVIPDERCISCLLEWLRKPMEVLECLK